MFLCGQHKQKVKKDKKVIMDGIVNFFDEIGKAFLSFDFLSDLLDVAFVTFLIYNAIKLLRGTRAFQVLKAILILIIVFGLVNLFGMEASEYIFKQIFNNAILIFLILFSPEIRQILENVGRRSLKNIPIFNIKNDEVFLELQRSVINDVCKAAGDMSAKRCGALIVFEKDAPLKDVIETGTVIDAASSPELINSIFFKNSALHDGALVVSLGKLYSAGCILPLTQNSLDSELGTRHRAAIGMSEASDAAVVIVSEENGHISLACGGKLSRNLSTSHLREQLFDYLLPRSDDDSTSIKKLFSKKVKKGSEHDEK